MLNTSSGDASLTATTSTFNGASGTTILTIRPGSWACPTSDGTNWPSQAGHYNTFPGQFSLAGTLTPTALSGNVDNYAPAGIENALALRIGGGAANRNITGITGGIDGRIITITNIGTTNNLVLVNDATSTAANRFLLSAANNVTLPPSTALALRYDGTSQRWRPFTRALSDTGVTAAPYTCANITVGADGRITTAANGVCSGATGIASGSATLGWTAGTDVTKAIVMGPVSTATTVTDIRGKLIVAEGAAATMMLRKAASTEDCTAAGNADAQTTATFDLNGTAPANQNLTLVGGAPNVLAAGDSICAEITGTTLVTKGSINVTYTVP